MTSRVHHVPARATRPRSRHSSGATSGSPVAVRQRQRAAVRACPTVTLRFVTGSGLQHHCWPLLCKPDALDGEPLVWLQLHEIEAAAPSPGLDERSAHQKEFRASGLCEGAAPASEQPVDYTNALIRLEPLWRESLSSKSTSPNSASVRIAAAA